MGARAARAGGDRWAVTVIDAPLTARADDADGLPWYDEAALADGLDRALGAETIELLVVDGPPAYAAGHGLGRYPAFPVLRPRLAPGATVVLDDIERPGEQDVLRRWESETDLVFDRHAESAGIAIARCPVGTAAELWARHVAIAETVRAQQRFWNERAQMAGLQRPLRPPTAAGVDGQLERRGAVPGPPGPARSTITARGGRGVRRRRGGCRRRASTSPARRRGSGWPIRSTPR